MTTWLNTHGKVLVVLVLSLLLTTGLGGRQVQANVTGDGTLPPEVPVAPADTSWAGPDSGDDASTPERTYDNPNLWAEKLKEEQQREVEEAASATISEDVGILALPPGPFTGCASVDVPEHECTALVSLYTATGGSSWTHHTNWLENNQVCSWYGITCNGSNVSTIDLSYNGLSGMGSGDFSGFTNLVYINIGGNNVGGNLTNMIDNIFPSGLETLYLFWNDFNGTIDSDIAGMTSLTHLNVCGNSIDGSLTTIFTYLPTSLEMLKICYNDFTGTIPSDLSSLTNLFLLDVGANYLVGDMSTIIGYMPTTMNTLQMYYNGFTGTIPAGISSLTSLSYLDLAANSLDGDLGTIIGNLPISIHYLYLNANGFTGTVPASMAGLTNITHLNFSENNLVGDMSTVIGNIPSTISSISLGTNDFTGTIPSGISGYTQLSGLRLNENQLTGDLGTIIGNLPASIRYLYLYDNNFTGTIPASISELPVLTDFVIAYNLGLSGTIPMDITDLSLTTFNFTNTNLCEPDDPDYDTWKAGVLYYYSGLCLRPFNGGATIYAPASIAAIGRPHMGSEIMAYNGVSSGALDSYLPMLFNDTWGSYTSSFTVQNSGGGLATFSIEFMDALTGTTTCMITGETLPLNGVKTYDVTNLPDCNGGGSMPTGWYGGATISSDETLVVVAKPDIEGTDRVTYNAFSSGAPTVFLPMLFRNIWGYQSAVYIQNLDPSLPANVTLNFYDNTGAYTCSYADPAVIDPGVTRGYWLANITNTSCTGGTGFSTSGWAGSMVVTTGAGSANIVALARPHMGSEVAAYTGVTAGSTSNALPMLFRDKWGYDSAIYVQNVSLTPTDIEIFFYDTEGNYVCKYVDPTPLPVYATRGYWLPYVNCNIDGDFPVSGWAGSAWIITSQNSVAVGRPHLSNAQVVVYNSFQHGNLVMYVPMLFREYGGNESALYLQNLDCVPTTATITFYDEDSGEYCTMTKDLGVGAAGAIWLAGLDGAVCVP